MAISDFTWIEQVGGRQPGGSSWSMQNQAATGTFQLRQRNVIVNAPGGQQFFTFPLLGQDIYNAITTLVGTTNNQSFGINGPLGPLDDSGFGCYINRVMPAGHPQFPFLYVKNLDSVEGVGYAPNQFQPAMVTPTSGYTNAAAAAPPLPNWALYKYYDFKCSFGPLYGGAAIVPDSELTIISALPYYDDGGIQRTATVVNEWQRFVDYGRFPINDFATFQQGQMVFQTTGIDQLSTRANGSKYPAMPKIFLPNSLIKLIWYGVPHRYITSPNSYLSRYVGRVNQNAFADWQSGQLLFMNANPTRYQMPIPPALAGISTFSTTKLCNIEMTFLMTSRVSPDAPALAPNRSWVTAGHNLLPWFKDRRFHYAHGQDNVATNQVPSWLSFRFELLFCDPDYEQDGFNWPNVM